MRPTLDPRPAVEQPGTQVAAVDRTRRSMLTFIEEEAPHVASHHPEPAQTTGSARNNGDATEAATARHRTSGGRCTIACDPGPPPLLKVTGDLDCLSLPMLRAAVESVSATAQDVQLDLSDVDFADLRSAAFLIGPRCRNVAMLTPSRAVERAVTLLNDVRNEPASA